MHHRSDYDFDVISGPATRPPPPPAPSPRPAGAASVPATPRSADEAGRGEEGWGRTPAGACAAPAAGGRGTP